MLALALLARGGGARVAFPLGMWVLVGVAAVVVPLLLLVTFTRRIDRPLRELTAALDRVGSGDLTVQIPVRRADELGRLAQHFNGMTRVLRDRAEGQGHFAAIGELLAGMAHEVNNPLQAISALAESRLDEEGLLAAQRADYLQFYRQARRAGRLLAGLLRFVRPPAASEEDLDVSDAASRVVELLSYRFGVDEIRMDNRVGPALPRVRGAATHLEQILLHLLSNAIDAVCRVPSPRRVVLEAWEHEGRVYLAVTDNGAGIAPEMAPRLFQPFATSKGERGAGLGLYVSREMARGMGGDVERRSAPGEGARFVAWFPGVPLAAVEAPPAVATRAPDAGRRPLADLAILLVDDEEPVRRPIVRYLSRLGATVIEAGDGLTAYAQLKRVAVDVIVLDLRMPGMNGAAFHEKLRAERPELGERVLFLSGDPEQLARQGAALPAGRVLMKPVELADLFAAVARVAGRGGA